MTDEAALGAWRALLSTHAALVRGLDATLSAEHRLSLNDFDVLHQLAAAPGGRLRLGELSDRVLFSRAGLTGLVRRLEAAGLVTREPTPEDRRGALAVLTPAGAERFAAAKRTQLDFVRDAFDPEFGAADLELLRTLLLRAVPRDTRTVGSVSGPRR